MRPVTDEQMLEIEAALLPAGKTFDSPRRAFIRELNTCDLQAVPGSGKTTVLLAKLLAFEQQLPLQGGQGILVISHTNTAVDEIKKKLNTLSPKLFSFPSYIGTIQAFVDQFLSIPYYCHKYGHKPVRIDNEIYSEKISQMRNRQDFTARFWVNRKNDPQAFLEGLRLNADLKLCNRKGELFTEVAQTTNTYLSLRGMKEELLRKGFLCFDDAYLLARLYISEYPEVIQLLRKRFKFVFVDEMQDMDRQQHDLLETLFHSGNAATVYQRIGDRNQSIFSDGNDQETVWIARANTLTIAGSNRLSPSIAKVVRPFGLYDNIDITGHGPSTLKPHILLYEDGAVQNVLPYFAGLVQSYRATGDIHNFSDPVKAIGWVGKQPEPSKTFIGNYHNPFNKESQNQKVDHQSLASYLHAQCLTTSSYREARSGILSAMLKVLRLQGLRASNRDYSKMQFLHELKIAHGPLLGTFNANMMQWCNLLVVNKDVATCQQAITAYFPAFLNDWKGVSILRPEVTAFLMAPGTAINVAPQNEPTGNTFVLNDLNIEVTTIHSVKGETHSATLYLETTYFSHETEKCLNQLLGTSATTLTNQVRKREASKMMYVGFSRATCFLCFAAAKSRLARHKDNLELAGWTVLEI
jgi:DNA helicase-2/ATP-dependent DNA helicase PcrA